MSRRSIGLALLVVGGCGDGGGPGAEPITILELPPRIARTCTVPSPTTVISDNEVQGFSLGVDGSGLGVFTSRFDDTVALAALGVDPVALALPEWTAATTWDSTSHPSITPREGGGWGLAWSELGIDPTVTSRIAIAAVDAIGAQVGAITYVPTEVEVYGAELVARPGGFALAWVAATTLHFLTLDLGGVPTGPAVTIATGPVYGVHLARHGDGFAIAWSESDGEVTDAQIVLLDAGGAVRSEAQRLPTRGDRLSSSAPFIASAEGELLVAWVEAYDPEVDGDESGYTIVRLARLTETGEVVEPTFRLQAPEPGFVNLNASVVIRPDAITLSWSRGDYIAVCGGCVSDNRMHLVQLDPVDLAPVSNVAEVVGPSGLRSAPIVTTDGLDFAYLLAIDHHARFELAAAAVRCAPSP